jgi:hypothetical protein
VPERQSWRCRIGWHHLVDFPDPNPETRGLEQQGYRACTRCATERDRVPFLPRRGLIDRPPGY